MIGKETHHFVLEITGVEEEIWKKDMAGEEVEVIEEEVHMVTEVEGDITEEAEVGDIMTGAAVDTAITWMDHSQVIQGLEAIIHQVGQTENRKA